MKIFYQTFGCKANQYETQELTEYLARVGYEAVDSAEDADVIVINSCTVTAESDRKTRQALRTARKSAPDCILALTGCSSQASPESYRDFPGVDIVMGNANAVSLEKALSECLANRTANQLEVLAESNSESHSECPAVFEVKPHIKGEAYSGTGVTRFDGHTRAFLKIQDGCDRFCSYCIIPTARGRSRSKALEEIKKELNSLASNGYKEIVLTGINLSDYGKGTAHTLADAVRLCEDIDGILRVRLGSLEPDHLTDGLIEQLAACGKLCGHFHISLQSGCDKTLRDMNRHYNCREYAELCGKLKEAFPGCSLTTDIMTGFPGESDSDFDETLRFADSIGFEKIHVFPYSVRPGTKAASLCQLDESVKRHRAAILTEHAAKMRESLFSERVGSSVQVLFEAGNNNEYTGYTREYLPFTATSEESLTGRVFTADITHSDTDTLYGVLSCEIN